MNYYDEIKNKLIDNEIYKRAKDYSKNKNELDTYYNVGKLLIEAQGGEERAKYGDKIIKEYSKKLMKEIDKKYSYRNLMNMRKFYLIFKNKKLNAVRSLLTWTHYRQLLKFNDNDEINYYIEICIKNHLSTRKLQEKINMGEYQRLSDDVRSKLIKKEVNEIQDLIKNPIIIKNICGKEKITEKILKRLILENIDNFLEELGEGFTYIKNEYPIKMGDKYNYIDLLLFNYIYNCFVVVEIKITELKKEHVGQIQIYMNYINENVKTINQNDTIGIIICKENNKFVIKYSSDPRIYSTSYILN